MSAFREFLEDLARRTAMGRPDAAVELAGIIHGLFVKCGAISDEGVDVHPVAQVVPELTRSDTPIAPGDIAAAAAAVVVAPAPEVLEVTGGTAPVAPAVEGGVPQSQPPTADAAPIPEAEVVIVSPMVPEPAPESPSGAPSGVMTADQFETPLAPVVVGEPVTEVQEAAFAAFFAEPAPVAETVVADATPAASAVVPNEGPETLPATDPQAQETAQLPAEDSEADKAA